MRIAFLAWLFLATSWSACGYDDSNLDGIAFACDATHPCPDNGPCVAGRCSVNQNLGRQGVQCGSAVCALGSSCCDEVISPLYCTSFGGCPAKEIRCDGPEDCTGGNSCCLEGSLSICRASCDTLEICARDADCAGAGPGASTCCPFPFGPALNLRACGPLSC